MLSPKNSISMEAHADIIKRVQKLELATSRLLTDTGKMGEGYMQPMATASENAIALAQKQQIDQLLMRLTDVENLSMRQ